MFKPGDRVICRYKENDDTYINLGNSYTVKCIGYVPNHYTQDDEDYITLILVNCEGEVYYQYQFILDKNQIRKDKLKKIKKISNKLNFKLWPHLTNK